MGAFLPTVGLAAIAALAISGTANAAVTITSFTANQLVVPAGEQLADSFDGAVAPGFSVNLGSVGQIVSGTSANQYQAPAGDSSQYLAVLRDPSAVATLFIPSTTTNISFYVGSIDTYNTITFVSTSGPNTVFTGSQLLARTGGATDGRFLFDLTGQNIGSITFNSTQNALELDNVAASVPEPGVWAMMMLGLGGLGYALRRRRYAVSAAAVA